MQNPYSLTMLSVTVVALGCHPNGAEQKEIKNQPNILILLADDLGYSDLNCYGGTAKTPALDKLAAENLKFTNCYAAAPNCSPSRVGLLTGRVPARAGMYSYRPHKHPMHLMDEEVTIAEILKEKGYQTAHFGKWHLGCLPQDTVFNHPQPHEQGFDYSLGTENNSQPTHLNPVNFVRNGKALGEVKGYSCQIVADEWINWMNIKCNSEKPWFTYVAFHEPHKKIASPPEMIKNYPDASDQDAEYFANVENLDNAIGRILSGLNKLGIDDNTLIFFFSDNGPYRPGSADPLRGLKSEVYDGGIKVPGIIKWKTVAPEAKQIDEPIWFEDILPTICAITKAELPDKTIDGTNILPLLKAEDFQRESPMFWYFYRTHPEATLQKNGYVINGIVQDTFPRVHQLNGKQ